MSLDSVHRWFNRIWYQGSSWYVLMLPLTFVFSLLSALRKTFYRLNVFSSLKTPVPVIVVGNITVGGTGKSPVVSYIVKCLLEHGYKPGVISRGYKSKNIIYPYILQSTDVATIVGDEPYMLFNQLDVPVCVGSDRIASVSHLVNSCSVDVVVSDDGLQHYRMQRDIELAVIDGERGVGNGFLLPAGPLREPISRLNEVDFVLSNGDDSSWLAGYSFLLSPTVMINLKSGESLSVGEWIEQYSQEYVKGAVTVHRVAGLGNPQRFFRTMDDLGITGRNHDYPDHHMYKASDLDFGNDLIVMTEKDAVKCKELSVSNENRIWYLKVDVKIDEAFGKELLSLLSKYIEKRSHE